jgi:integrase
MHRDSNRLTALKVAKITQPGRYGDGGGLVLQVSKWRTKAWIFRFQRDGRERQMGLGAVHTLSLAEARERARDCRKILLHGLDPIEARQAERMQRRIETARGVTFKECAERYIAVHEAAWRNEKHRQQWRSTLSRYAYPVLENLSVSAIDVTNIIKVLEPIWMMKPETAARVRGRIEGVLDWATVRGFRAGDNPARWRGDLDKLLPARTKIRQVKHHPALPHTDLPAFMAGLRDRKTVSARALEFTILTAARTSEVIHAKWSEFDLSTAVWTVPAKRMKGGREHRVPLSDRAIAILKALPRDEDGSGFAFVGARAGKPLSNMAMLEVMRGMQPGYVPHGCRSTFRDWAAETTNYPNHVVEMALAHTIGDKVEAAYRRGDLFEKRRRLMNTWAAFCAKPAISAEVLTLKRRP